MIIVAQKHGNRRGEIMINIAIDRHRRPYAIDACHRQQLMIGIRSHLHNTFQSAIDAAIAIKRWRNKTGNDVSTTRKSPPGTALTVLVSVQYRSSLDVEMVAQQVGWAKQFGKKIVMLYESNQVSPGYFNYEKAREKCPLRPTAPALM